MATAQQVYEATLQATLQATLDAMAMDDPAECGDGLQLLDIIEALGAHFHEHQADVLRWPWKLFCVKWRRMMVQVAKREADRARDKRQRELSEAQRAAEMELRQAHAQAWGD